MCICCRSPCGGWRHNVCPQYQFGFGSSHGTYVNIYQKLNKNKTNYKLQFTTDTNKRKINNFLCVVFHSSFFFLLNSTLKERKSKLIHKSTRILLNFSQSLSLSYLLPVTISRSLSLYLSLSTSLSISLYIYITPISLNYMFISQCLSLLLKSSFCVLAYFIKKLHFFLFR